MSKIIIMPRQGQSVESCVITKLAKGAGEPVAVGDVLFSYETDKSAFDEVADTAGVLLAFAVAEGDDVPCLEPVCLIGEPGEEIPAEFLKNSAGTPAHEAPAQAAPEIKAAAQMPEAAPAPSAVCGEAHISPRARTLAEKCGADYTAATPTGPNGRIIERDINRLLDNPPEPAEAIQPRAEREAFAQELPAAPAPAAEYTEEKTSGIRRVIAKQMHASLSEMAQLTLNSSFDATEMLAFRAKLKADSEEMGLGNITINDMVLFAVAKTLPRHPYINAHFLGDTIRLYNTVNLGIAVDTDRGLIVPTLPGAEKLTLGALSAAAKSLIREAQSGKISPDKLRDGSFTVTNLGSLGVESFTPVINPPQTAILGVNNITYKNKADGSVYPAMGLSLTFDHRAVDGAPAARFLQELCRGLEKFTMLLL